MSGNRQHFIPRFLQKGFASKSKRQEVYTWVFIQDNSPYEANLKNIGLEKHFYGKPEESEVDDKITEAEKNFSKFINEMRSKEVDTEITNSLPAEFISHLLIRNKHIRESMHEAGREVLKLAKRNLNTSGKLEKMLSNYLRENPEEIKSTLRKELNKKLPPEVPYSQRDVLIGYIMSSLVPKMLPNAAEKGLPMLTYMLGKLGDEIPKIVKGSHLKALSETVVPEAYIKHFENFSWCLIVNAPNSFILGDIGPIGIYKPNNEFRPFLFSKGDIVQVILPISHCHLIIGSSSKKTDIPTKKVINEASASLSKNYFISSKISKYENELSKIIGTKSSILTDEEIAKVEIDLTKKWFAE